MILDLNGTKGSKMTRLEYEIDARKLIKKIGLYGLLDILRYITLCDGTNRFAESPTKINKLNKRVFNYLQKACNAIITGQHKC